jgi:hypothetical protein
MNPRNHTSILGVGSKGIEALVPAKLAELLAPDASLRKKKWSISTSTLMH